MNLELTEGQETALERGEVVVVTIVGKECVLMRSELYRVLQAEDYDASPWTTEEMNLLAAETAELLSGDGFDEVDES